MEFLGFYFLLVWFTNSYKALPFTKSFYDPSLAALGYYKRLLFSLSETSPDYLRTMLWGPSDLFSSIFTNFFYF